jgi:hypothetical protein
LENSFGICVMNGTYLEEIVDGHFL